MRQNEGQGLRGMSHCSGTEKRLQREMKGGGGGGGCLGFQLPVSLFENETLFFYPGPPALGTHPLACIDHSWREPCEEGGKKRISNRSGEAFERL